MRVCGEIKCYYCGYVSGQICGELNGPFRASELRPNPNFKGALPKPGDPLRCFRCGGPIYLDELEKVKAAPRHDRQLARRERRKKRAVAA